MCTAFQFCTSTHIEYYVTARKLLMLEETFRVWMKFKKAIWFRTFWVILNLAWMTLKVPRKMSLIQLMKFNLCDFAWRGSRGNNNNMYFISHNRIETFSIKLLNPGQEDSQDLLWYGIFNLQLVYDVLILFIWNDSSGNNYSLK